jgi:hypothetical protein
MRELAYRYDFDWVHLPVFSDIASRSKTDWLLVFPTYIFLGLRRMHTIKSALLSETGVGADAAFLAQQIASRTDGADVRFGSLADICSALGDVRFTPKSGHVQCTSLCPLWANSGHRVSRLERPGRRKNLEFFADDAVERIGAAAAQCNGEHDDAPHQHVFVAASGRAKSLGIVNNPKCNGQFDCDRSSKEPGE